MASVVLRGLTKRFDSVVAVNRLDLEIGHGELVSLLGPSGCGKTTTLRLLAGFVTPDEGEIIVGGKTISSARSTVPPEKRNMSMIFQSYAVWPHLTVYQNVAYGLRLRKVSGVEERERVQKMLAVVRLEMLGDRFPGELSGGQQQRVALARALVIEPEILLLDEPLSNLDANLREEMRFEIRRLHDQFRITTVYVTHDQAEAMVISDRIAVMSHGELEQIGTPEEIYERPATHFVAGFVGQTNSLVGVLEDAHVVRCQEGLRLRTAGNGHGLNPGDPVTVCVRPHEIGVYRERPGLGETVNVCRGVVRRHTYLGDCRDYLVDLEPGNVTIRAVAGPGRRHGEGEAVFVSIDPEACRILRR